MAQNEGKVGRTRKKSASAKPDTIAFDYIKGNYYRVIQIDGVMGGIAPSGAIHMAIWNQRQPYPRQVVHELSSESKVGEEVDRTSREGLVREVEAGLVFSPSLARAIIKWLEDRLEDLRVFDEAEAAEETQEMPESES